MDVQQIEGFGEVMDVTGKYLLGIDLGTSSCKVAITDAGGKIIDADMEKYPLKLTVDGGVEQKPDDWWHAITGSVHRMVERNSEIADSIASVGVVGQFSGTVPVDANGEPLRDAIIWMDTRGEPSIRLLTGGFPSLSGYRLDKLYSWIRKTGGAPAHSGKDSLAHILYLKDSEPVTYRETHKFLEPKDYINMKLTGDFIASYDSMVLHWVTDNRNLEKIKIDKKLVRLAGLDFEKLPEMKHSVDVIAHMSKESAGEFGIPVSATVVAGAGDIQSSLIGSGCTRDYQTELYLGTSSWITSHVPFKRTSLRSNIASLPSAMPERYFIAAEQESAGGALEFARQMLYDLNDKKIPTFEEMDHAVEQSLPGSGGLIFLPWLFGERAPVEDKNLRGAFFNLTMKADRGDIIRAVMEGVALNLNWLLNPVEKLAGKLANPIRMAGGGALTATWPKIMADVLDRNIQVVEDPVHVNARGAALLASVGSGMITFDEIAERIPLSAEFSPNKDNHAMYAKKFDTFLQLYSKFRKSFVNAS